MLELMHSTFRQKFNIILKFETETANGSVYRFMIWFKKMLFVLSFFTLMACDPTNAERKITLRAINKAQHTIDYLAFSDNLDQSKTISFVLLQGDSIRTELKLLARGDGAYKVSYKFLNRKDTLTQQFGYFTNGAPLESELVLKLYTDSVSIVRVP